MLSGFLQADRRWVWALKRRKPGLICAECISLSGSHMSERAIFQGSLDRVVGSSSAISLLTASSLVILVLTDLAPSSYLTPSVTLVSTGSCYPE